MIMIMIRFGLNLNLLADLHGKTRSVEFVVMSKQVFVSWVLDNMY